MRSEYWLEIGMLVFHEGVAALQSGCYKDCLNCMHNCHRPVHEARKGCNSRTESELNVLDEDVLMQRCVAESIQARITGDELLEFALKDIEDLNMNVIFDVIDWFRQAILLTRERDVEQEAIAHARLGHVFGQVLALKVPARENYKTAIQLALSMHPRTFTEDAWYKECTEMLQKYQDESILGEEKNRQEEQKTVYKELESEMRQLGEHSGNSDHDFLKFVYSTFPPKKPAHKLEGLVPTCDQKTLKKILQKSVIHYHPDKVNVLADGLKFKVLCEEITKRLTRRYELMKGISL